MEVEHEDEEAGNYCRRCVVAPQTERLAMETFRAKTLPGSQTTSVLPLGFPLLMAPHRAPMDTVVWHKGYGVDGCVRDVVRHGTCLRTSAPPRLFAVDVVPIVSLAPLSQSRLTSLRSSPESRGRTDIK